VLAARQQESYRYTPLHGMDASIQRGAEEELARSVAVECQVPPLLFFFVARRFFLKAQTPTHSARESEAAW
jgi:hypothetical protein